jgi:queuine tRNA-ribosyltransferase
LKPPFTVTVRDSRTRARTGILETGHGPVETPVFLPVGTQATVKTLSSGDLEDLGATFLLGNTYHLYLRPGVEVIGEAGGLHEFMAWKKALFTDSGGYQVMSLARLNRIGEEGVTFRSHLDGSLHEMTPEGAVEIQVTLGSDVVVALDECVPYPCGRGYAEEAVARTTSWARRSRRVRGSAWDRDGRRQLLFGVVQGSVYPDLRRRSARELAELDFAGYAVGGLSVGEPGSVMEEMTGISLEELPEDRPRHLLGVGTPADLVRSVALGVDQFDCVLPTRNARNGSAFTEGGRLSLKNARFVRDPRPLDDTCACPTCRTYSRRYLSHLVRAKEILGLRLLTVHNLHFYLDLMRRMREAVRAGRFASWSREFLGRQAEEAAE